MTGPLRVFDVTCAQMDGVAIKVGLEVSVWPPQLLLKGLSLSTKALSKPQPLCRGDPLFPVGPPMQVLLSCEARPCLCGCRAGRRLLSRCLLHLAPRRTRIGLPSAIWRWFQALSCLEMAKGPCLTSKKLWHYRIVRVKMNAKLSGEASGTLIPEFLGDSAIPILLELRFNVGVSVPSHNVRNVVLRSKSTSCPSCHRGPHLKPHPSRRCGLALFLYCS